MYSVWRVTADGQQECADHTAFNAIGHAGAVGLAKLMARDSRGATCLGNRRNLPARYTLGQLDQHLSVTS
jgi:hypothetical protein